MIIFLLLYMITKAKLSWQKLVIVLMFNAVACHRDGGAIDCIRNKSRRYPAFCAGQKVHLLCMGNN